MTDIRRLTDEERCMLRYFHKERGDITRYVAWDELRPILERWHPELLKAHADLVAAERILDLVVKALDT